MPLSTKKPPLDEELPCFGMECDVEVPRAVGIASTNGTVRYYEYVPPACVGLTFFEGKLAQYHHSGLYVDVSSPEERRLATPIARALLRAAPSVRRLRSM